MRRFRASLAIAAVAASLATGCDPVLMAALDEVGKDGPGAASPGPGASARPATGPAGGPIAAPSPRAPRGGASARPAAPAEPTDDGGAPDVPDGDVGADVDPAWADEALAEANALRDRLGLKPFTHDPEMDAACHRHGVYLALNYGAPETEGLKAHDEVAGLPGTSPEGAAAGKDSVINYGVGGREAVQGWLGSLYHRLRFLAPLYTKMGFGGAVGPEGAITMFYTRMDDDPGSVQRTTPFVYPYDGQTGVPLAFGGEVPNPVPEAGAMTLAGYPVTLQLPIEIAFADVDATLTDAGGEPVDCWVLTPDNNPLGGFQRGTVCLFPKTHLKPGTRYTAHVAASTTWLGEDPGSVDETWSFTTAEPIAVDATDEAAMRRASGEVARVRGQVRQVAGLSDGSGHVFYLDGGGGLDTLVYMSAAGWAAFEDEGWRSPDDLKGEEVEVLGTLETHRPNAYFRLQAEHPDELVVVGR